MTICGRVKKKMKIMRALARVYVEFFQNTPLLIQVFMLYNALPILYPKAMIPVIVIGIAGVGMYHGAYIGEVVRAGIQSIGRGQLVTVGGTMADVFVADDKVADVQIKSQRQLYVFGKAGGETTIYASDASGNKERLVP